MAGLCGTADITWEGNANSIQYKLTSIVMLRFNIGEFAQFKFFYYSRRTDDDERQIGRWKNCCGPKGRWKGNLVGKIARAGVAYNNNAISPVVRQTLQHWGYRLTEKDYNEGKKRVKM